MQILEALLPKGMIIPSAFEIVGHIAHLNLKDEHLPYKKLIAKVFGVYKSSWQFIVNLNGFFTFSGNHLLFLFLPRLFWITTI